MDQPVEPVALLRAELHNILLYGSLFRGHDASPSLRRNRFREPHQNQRRGVLACGRGVGGGVDPRSFRGPSPHGKGSILRHGRALFCAAGAGQGLEQRPGATEPVRHQGPVR
jgi:hypothetical protein